METCCEDQLEELDGEKKAMVINESAPLLAVNDANPLDERWLKRRIWINIILICLELFFLLIGIMPITSLQSSLNSEAGLGVISMAVRTGFMIFGSILAPPVINVLGCKLAIVVGCVLYIVYIPANFYPTWYVMIPAAAVSGIGYSVESVARHVYVARLAHLYADVTRIDANRVNSRIFSIIAMAAFTSTLGNFFASLILNIGAETPPVDNITTYRIPEQNLDVCGINYCNQPLNMTNGSEAQPSINRIYLLIAFCTLSSLFSLFLVACLDPLKTFRITSRNVDANSSSSPVVVVKTLLIALKNPFYLLLFPLVLALNGGDSFWTAQFTKGFITCAIGMSYVGYVSAWSGLGSAIFCLILGWVNNKKIRCVPMVSSSLIQLATLTVLFYWTPSTTSESTNYWQLSAFGFVFHIGSGIRHFITPVLVSVVFKNNLETAFMVYHFWSNLSSTLFYIGTNYLCISCMVYFLMVTMALSFISYVCLELLIWRKT